MTIPTATPVWRASGIAWRRSPSHQCRKICGSGGWGSTISSTSPSCSCPASGRRTPIWIRHGASEIRFAFFAAIPAEARYRFLLENSEVVVGGITYGPVCNGQIATYAIKDQFWVFFLDPAHDASVQNPKLGLETWDVFMNRSPFGNAEYVKAYAAAQARLTPEGWSLDALWDGGGENPNAWLTILRHETNVSVTQGGRGGIPRTYWLVSYSGLERMYYDTVASFKYWGSDGHKLETLLFFNFLRQEFEDNFLKLLPSDRREAVREQWTQGVGSIGLMVVPFAGDKQPTQVQLDDADPVLDLVSKIRRTLGPTISGGPDRLNPQTKPVIAEDAPIPDFDAWETAISTLTAIKGYTFVRHLPSVILLRLKDDTRYRVYSLVANRVYKSPVHPVVSKRPGVAGRGHAQRIPGCGERLSKPVRGFGPGRRKTLSVRFAGGQDGKRLDSSRLALWRSAQQRTLLATV